MPLANGSSQEIISKNIGQLISEGYSREEAAAIAYNHAGESKDTSRVADRNGFVTIEDNPISKVGIFEYSGAQIRHPDPLRQGEVFKVYRPAEELADPECINSFKLVPFIDEHAMLGPEEIGRTPAERKGVQGVIGEKVYFDGEYLRGNLKLFSEAIKGAVNNGKKELSPGYTSQYELTPGVWEGQNYDAIQRTIRGNHLALVKEGRSGPDVAVLDRMVFTVDAKEFSQMADETTNGDSIAKIKALLDELKPLLAEQAEAQKMLQDAGLIPAATTDNPTPATKDDETVIPDPDDKTPETIVLPETVGAIAADAEGMKALQGTMDAILKVLHTQAPVVASMDKRLKAVEGVAATMDSVLVSGIAKRDELAGKLSDFVGTFDAKGLTLQGVAEYGVTKLSIPCSKGGEVQALEAWMHGREAPHKARTINTFDTKTNASAADNALLGHWGDAK